MGWDSEKYVDFYYGEYRNGILGKKHHIELGVYPSRIQGTGFQFCDNELSKGTYNFEISFDEIIKIYMEEINKQTALFIKYNSHSIVSNKKDIVVLLGIVDVQRWYNLLKETQNIFWEKKQRKQRAELQRKEEQLRLAGANENRATSFYKDCYSFHIKENTPTYQLFSDKNKIGIIYIDENRALNFLKIDGYTQEESHGMISYDDIHYFEKAGKVSYTTDIHGDYSSFGGSMTGGSFSKLATVGGGLMFGLMGMVLGAALTYKPAEQKSAQTSFSIDSNVRKIDDRSVILNFYSETRKQYIDVELPQEIYNFLQTYLPEKRYGVVDELEKKAIIHQSVDMIENGNLLKIVMKSEVPIIKEKSTPQVSTMDAFKQKVEKLKIMKEAGLLSDEKFEEEQNKLLKML